MGWTIGAEWRWSWLRLRRRRALAGLGRLRTVWPRTLTEWKIHWRHCLWKARRTHRVRACPLLSVPSIVSCSSCDSKLFRLEKMIFDRSHLVCTLELVAFMPECSALVGPPRSPTQHSTCSTTGVIRTCVQPVCPCLLLICVVSHRTFCTAGGRSIMVTWTDAGA